MRRSTEAAFCALKGLDPAERVAPVVPHPGPSDATVEIQIERILALPRAGHPHARAHGRAHGRAWAEGRHHPRYGMLGLIASAVIAVMAMLVWVSPSAGAPPLNAGGGSATVSHITGQQGIVASSVVLG